MEQLSQSSGIDSANIFDLSGRRALVTGGAGSLGRSMAEGLRDAGATVAILGRSSSVYEAAEEMSSDGQSTVFAVKCDLQKRANVPDGFNKALEMLGGLDILVTSHGVSIPGDASLLELKTWDSTLEVNLVSVFSLCQLASREMTKIGGGKIINIASMLSFFGGFRAAPYAASKGGVAQLTKALANEWAPLGINVNAIAPGYIKSELNRHYWSDPTSHDMILQRIPAGRWGNPEDLKGVAVFLSSHASDYLHGVILPVDGGYAGR